MLWWPGAALGDVRCAVRAAHAGLSLVGWLVSCGPDLFFTTPHGIAQDIIITSEAFSGPREWDGGGGDGGLEGLPAHETSWKRRKRTKPC